MTWKGSAYTPKTDRAVMTGPELVALREKAGFSKSDLAAKLGVQPLAVHRWENEFVQITHARAMAIKQVIEAHEKRVEAARRGAATRKSRAAA